MTVCVRHVKLYRLVPRDMKMGQIHAKSRITAVIGRLIGYAGVSTEDQGTDPQLEELRAAACDPMREEHASGADRTRPVLTGLLRDIRPGETRPRTARLPQSPALVAPPCWQRVVSAASRAAACWSSTGCGPSRPRFRARGLPGEGERKASNANGGTTSLPLTFEQPKLLAGPPRSAQRSPRSARQPWPAGHAAYAREKGHQVANWANHRDPEFRPLTAFEA
jgi:hypothetical protein